MMTRILAIDTTGQACSVALNNGGSVAELYEVIPKLHARRILPMVNRLMDEAGYSLGQLDAIAFANGPGSFTGIRIAASIAQGLAFGSDLPLIPVSSLAVLAQTCLRETEENHFMIAIDARMDQVYWACYRGSDEWVVLQGEEQLLSPEQVSIPSAMENDWLAAGDGWRYKDRFPPSVRRVVCRVMDECHSHAQDLAVLAMHNFNLGNTQIAESALPNYLRGKGAWKKSVK